jgi:hypothetical protein
LEKVDEVVQIIIIEHLEEHRHTTFDILTFEFEFIDVEIRDHSWGEREKERCVKRKEKWRMG